MTGVVSSSTRERVEGTGSDEVPAAAHLLIRAEPLSEAVVVIDHVGRAELAAVAADLDANQTIREICSCECLYWGPGSRARRAHTTS